MPIKAIKIRDSNGTLLEKYDSTMRIRVTRESHLDVYALAGKNIISVWGLNGKSILDNAYDKWMAAWSDNTMSYYGKTMPGRYVSQVNETTKPTQAGQLYINTDACMGWTPIGWQRHNYFSQSTNNYGASYFVAYKNILNTFAQYDADAYYEHEGITFNDPAQRGSSSYAVAAPGNGIELYNMCVTCPDTCDRSAKLRRLYESLKMRINELKDLAYIDIPFYEKEDTPARRLFHDYAYDIDILTGLNDQDEEHAQSFQYLFATDYYALTHVRLKYMLDNITDMGSACDVPALPFTPYGDIDRGAAWSSSPYAGVKDTSLPSEYFAFGAYITTVHMWNYYLLMCGTKTTIVEAKENASGFDINTYCNMYTYNTGWNIACEIEVNQISGDTNNSLYIALAEGHMCKFPSNNDAFVQIDHIAHNYKKILVICQSNNTIDRFSINVKILPFKYVAITDSNGNELTPADMNINPNFVDGDGYVRVAVGMYGSSIILKNNATLEDYSRAYPSVDSKRKNIWQLKVKWIRTNPTTHEDRVSQTTWLWSAVDTREPAYVRLNTTEG